MNGNDIELEPSEIHALALKASEDAAAVRNSLLPPEQERGLDCGFAWVVIKPARGKFVSYLKKQGIGSTRSYGGGGYEIWYSSLHKQATQSVSVHYAAATAYSEVLNKHGINSYPGSRLD